GRRIPQVDFADKLPRPRKDAAPYFSRRQRSSRAPLGNGANRQGAPEPRHRRGDGNLSRRGPWKREAPQHPRAIPDDGVLLREAPQKIGEGPPRGRRPLLIRLGNRKFVPVASLDDGSVAF